MVHSPDSGSTLAQALLPAVDLDESIHFFRETLGFRLERIFPADAPRVAIMSGFGITIRLDKSAKAGTAALCIETADAALLATGAAGLTAPAGVEIEVRRVSSTVEVPSIQDEVVMSLPASASAWAAGRAGMQYRDLIPGRLGGAVIASHIRIPEGGPVPDYVHHHHVRFQLIYCLRGWTRLVYEDQGPEFIMQAGDCVLQPPHIRHRVLECSDGFEVVEVGCPAEHETLVDHDLSLPNDRIDPGRNFAGQRFVHHRAADVSWLEAEDSGWLSRDTGIAAATGGLVAVKARRAKDGRRKLSLKPQSAFYFGFVVAGSVQIRIDGGSPGTLDAGASCVVPAQTEVDLERMSSDFEWFEVTASLRSAAA